MFTEQMLRLATQAVQSPIRRLVRGEDELTGSTVVMAQHRNGQFTVIAEHIIPERRASRVCECEAEHSVAKLGHCRTCPGYDPTEPNMVNPTLLRGSIGCPPRHADGSPHDFEWATYSDERMSTGVCRCGMSGLTWALLTLP